MNHRWLVTLTLAVAGSASALALTQSAEIELVVDKAARLRGDGVIG
jgi:hypothetical protein